jgi:dinuclear metal center YbgI/SA1388 family protein
MASRDDILAFCEELLEPGRFSDAMPNGLQVAGRSDVLRLATCASPSLMAFRQAAERGADMLLLHHGLFWERDPRPIHTLMAGRLRVLLEREINLVAYHLPLDAHPELGNNACLARLAGLEALDFDFARLRSMTLGCLGALPEPLGIRELSARLAKPLEAQPLLVEAGPTRVRRVGILSGGGGDMDMLLEARARGCDAFVTGSLSESGVAAARELGLNVVALGHYNSEKLGVRALGDRLVARFGLEVAHLDVPNPI